MAYIPNFKATQIPKKKYDQTIKSDPFYHANTWRKKSESQRTTHPYCRSCQLNGYVTLGHLADHIIPISVGGSKFDDRNIQTLCNPCHNRKRKLESMGIIQPHVLNDLKEKIPAL
jgi:5-methylcytosine-specific restriction endonuclease McrA